MNNLKRSHDDDKEANLKNSNESFNVDSNGSEADSNDSEYNKIVRKKNKNEINKRLAIRIFIF